MKLFVLGSGSRGNCFALVCDGAVLLIDAGFSAREIERRMADAQIDCTRLVGVALTHEHGDHASGATVLAARYDVPILASMGTWTAVRSKEEPCTFMALGTARSVTVGPFEVSACPTSHDAAEPVAIGVTMPGGVTLGAAYDLGRPTQAVRWFLRQRHCLILEANHDDGLLRTSGYPLVVQRRIAGPGGHLSNADAARLLDELHHDELRTVVLAHLSQRCNDHATARDTIGRSLAIRGFRGDLILAEQEGPMAAIQLYGPIQTRLFA